MELKHSQEHDFPKKFILDELKEKKNNWSQCISYV